MRFSTLLNMQKFVKGSLSTEVGFRITKVIINHLPIRLCTKNVQ